MIREPIREYLCSKCPHNHYHVGPAKKVSGIFLQPGTRYCDAGNRPLKFGKRDPKQRVPEWCPLYLSPRILRIYQQCSFWALIRVQKSSKRFYFESDYSVRYSGITDLTARTLFQRSKAESLYQILGMFITKDEIIEIDDGLKPYYFAVGKNERLTSISFDGARARLNKPEPDII